MRRGVRIAVALRLWVVWVEGRLSGLTLGWIAALLTVLALAATVA